MFTKEEIMNLLKSDILTLKLKPGTILSETALSERFQLSRTPLRDVLKQLSLESYIDVYPKKGNFVSHIDLDSVEQMIYMRSTLEKEIMKDLASQLSLKEMQELKEILDAQKAAIREENAADAFLGLDDQFHCTVYRLAGREFLWNLIQQSNVHYVRYRKLHMLEKGKLLQIWNEHQRMLEYMANKETAKIDDLVHHHLREDINSLEFLEKFSEYIKK
ncbi:DNA-binding GntR family transcriptional regulator [Fontibacillus phaseoli]|uniref:DNA-binding GntR family transcriptional regulator n=1 Tax=Fontibacillus phaseoli TaxID=1416533 RepID=A0A369BLS4_9BACL|nr:GntR family transcriptional regulator [Fontibacillus phaseoli]RCX22552.1 DNA-binding GntR family transcriptional regulator [Fontibacillus phaseoli]